MFYTNTKNGKLLYREQEVPDWNINLSFGSRKKVATAFSFADKIVSAEYFEPEKEGYDPLSYSNKIKIVYLKDDKEQTSFISSKGGVGNVKGNK